MFRVVIFDLVGVFSKHKNVYHIFKEITRYKGTVKSLKAYIGEYYEKLIVGNITELTFWRKLKEITKSRKSVDSLKREFLSKFKPTFNKKLFNKVRDNFNVALCSDFVSSWWSFLKSKYGIDFDYVVFSSSLKVSKPDKRLYLSVPFFFKIQPSQCLYVSDEVEDIRVAKELGMQTVFIPGKSKSCKEADYVYSNIDELLEVLS